MFDSNLDETKSKDIFNINVNENIKLALDQATINKIEIDFKDFIEYSKLDRILSRYEPNYKLLFNSFHSVISNENYLYEKLINLCKENEELKLKYDQALKLSSDDLKNKDSLLEQLEKAWNKVSLSASKEKRAMETINSLKLEVFSLSKLLEQEVGLTMGQEFNLRQVIKEKDSLINENKTLSEQLDELKFNLEELKKQQQDSNKIYEEGKICVAKANQELQMCQLELGNSNRKIEEFLKEIEILKNNCEKKEANTQSLNYQIQSLKLDNNNNELFIKDLNLCLDKNKKEIELQNMRFQKLQNEIDDLFIKNDSIMIENSQLFQQIRRQDALIDHAKHDAIHNQKQREHLERKVKLAEEQIAGFESDKQTFQNQILSLSKTIELLSLDKEADKKQIDLLVYEKEKLYTDLKRAHASKDKEASLIKTYKNQIKAYNTERVEAQTEINSLKKKIQNFDKERIDFVSCINEMALKNSNLNDELDVKQQHLTDSEKAKIENNKKQKEMQKLYDGVRMERNLYFKNINSAKEELDGLKSKLEKFETNELNLKRLIDKKDKDIQKLANVNSKVEKNFKDLNSKLNQKEKRIKEAEVRINQLEKDQNRFLGIVLELENSNKELRQNYAELKSERNIIGTQLIRRNDELCLLYEKTRIQESIIKRGYALYERLNKQFISSQKELRLAKSDNFELENQANLVKNLKKELDSNERQLIMEKAKQIATFNTQNVHRWRKLSGSDPDTYQLISKINILQKRLISKSEHVASLQLKFIEKDRMFIELKEFMSRRMVNEDTLTLIQSYKTTISNTTRQLKVNTIFFIKCCVIFKYKALILLVVFI